jgi:two-component system phosphate regulon sensor histidine kinase PhoR
MRVACRSIALGLLVVRKRNIMRESSNSIETSQRSGKLKKSGVVPQPFTWSMTATADPHQAHNFETLLLAIAGHDLRQPLQILQSANELLRLGPRTKSELRLLRSGQDAIDRLKEQLAQLVTALPFRERTKEARLAPVHVGQVIRQVRRDNEETALKKGIFIRSIPSDALVLSDRLLLSAALHNLVSNAVKYTQPGGRIVLGCRNVGSFIRIDVYDNGIGIPSDQVPKAFEAFTRLDATRRDGLGIGLFIVCQAIALLGHRIDVVSTPCRGSRFSIFVGRAAQEDCDQTRTTENELEH